MPLNPIIPREPVHEWVDDIADHKDRHKQTITYLVRSQRKLAKFVDANGRLLNVGGKHTALYLMGIVLRIFEA